MYRHIDKHAYYICSIGALKGKVDFLSAWVNWHVTARLCNIYLTNLFFQTNSKDGELEDKFQSLSLNNNEKKADTPIEEVATSEIQITKTRNLIT